MVQRTLTFTPAAVSSLPSWVPSTLFQWTVIPGSNIKAAGASVDPSPLPLGGNAGERSFNAECSFAVSKTGDLYMFGGGHGDYAGNEVYRIRLKPTTGDLNTAVCQRLTTPSPGITVAEFPSGYYPDGQPAARHTYSTMAFDDIRQKLYVFGSAAQWNSGSTATLTCDVFTPTANGGSWAPAGTMPNIPGAGQAFFATHAANEDRTTGDVWTWATPNFTPTLCKYTAATNTLQIKATGSPNTNPHWDNVAFDTLRRRLYRFGPSPYPPRYFDFSNESAITYGAPTLTGTAATQFTDPPAQHCFIYVPSMDCILRKVDDTLGTVYRMNVSTGVCDTLPVTAASGFTLSTLKAVGTVTCLVSQGHMHKRFQHVPDLKGCVYMPQWGPVYYLRTDP